MPLFELPMELDGHTEGNWETVISFLIGEEAPGSETSAATKADWNPVNSTSATEQRHFQDGFEI